MAAEPRDASAEAFAGGRWRPRRAWEDDPTVSDSAVRPDKFIAHLASHRRPCREDLRRLRDGHAGCIADLDLAGDGPWSGLAAPGGGGKGAGAEPGGTAEVVHSS